MESTNTIESTNNITIVMVCDDHYIVMLAALLKSIEVNHKTEEKIDAYIIEDHIKEINKIKLLSSISIQKITPHFIPLEEVITPKTGLPRDGSYFPFTIYARIFVSEWIPKTIRKLVYLDVDMIFKRDISELWKTGTTSDMQSILISMVRISYLLINGLISMKSGIPNLAHKMITLM